MSETEVETSIPAGPVRISLRETTLAIQIGEGEVWSFRPDGVLMGVYLDDHSLVRRLDGTLVQRGAKARVLSPAERAAVDAILRARVADILSTHESFPADLHGPLIALRDHGLDLGAREAALARSQPVMPPILPPDQYKAVPVTISEGCAFNGCTFCDLYLGREHRILDDESFQKGLERTVAIYQGSLATRTSVFLGDANALAAPMDILLDRMERVRTALPSLIEDSPGSRGRLAGFYSFLDLFTGIRHGIADYEALREHRLKRVYIGLETGDHGLQKWIGKPGSPERAAAMVADLKAAQLNVGIMVIPGLGGQTYAKDHVENTIDLIGRMELGKGDIVYLSPLSVRAGTPYAERAMADGVEALGDEGTRNQLTQMQNHLRTRAPDAKVTKYLVDRWIAT